MANGSSKQTPTAKSCSAKKPATKSHKKMQSAVGQLTLVEHALCPLSGSPATLPLIHKTRFQYAGTNGKPAFALTQVTAAYGLLPSDELLLWGLVAVALHQKAAKAEVFETPHWILRHLGYVDAKMSHGGREYRAFRSAIRRLSGVKYRCDGFYDPIRKEHRDVSFGLLSYDLPVSKDKSRKWRIVIDTVFFEFCGATGGRLFFDWPVYRSLDAASRRLYLFLAKVFSRKEWTHWLDVATLAVHVMGFSPSVDVRNLKQKLRRSLLRLSEAGILELPPDCDTTCLFTKREKGVYAVRLKRGLAFSARARRQVGMAGPKGPIAEQLGNLGIDKLSQDWIKERFAAELIETWVDIAKAAKAEFRDDFFKKGVKAYLIDNLKGAAKGTRTPPDWWLAKNSGLKAGILPWRDVCSTTRPGRPSSSPFLPERAFMDFLKGDGRERFEALVSATMTDLVNAGQERLDAHREAVRLSVDHLRKAFDHR